MISALWTGLGKVSRLFVAERPDRELQVRRIQSTERNIGLPVRLIVVGVVGYYLHLSPWLAEATGVPDDAMELIRAFLNGYVVLNVAASILLILMRRLSFGFIRWVVFGISLVDGLGLATLSLVTGGFDSVLYWFFLALIIRNAVSLPVAALQIMLNLSVCGLYLLAGLLYRTSSDIGIAAETLQALLPVDVSASGETESFLIRLFLLILMTFCCYGVQVLYDRNLRVQEEVRESHLRHEQLQAAGRLAAEIAHQLKNPLAIINNAAFNLQELTGRAAPSAAQQLAIIREEVDRSDQILTQLMGYAQLAEGKVERVDVAAELDRALAQVFPAAAKYQVAVQRDFEADLPPLLVQRNHLSAVFVNLLQNAREAMDGAGQLRLTVRREGDSAIQVIIEDNGSGIPAERQTRIFEPYYTTREKGTGLGLAIVKHNAELYGGKVRVESKLGQGARFILEFPTRTPAKATA